MTRSLLPLFVRYFAAIGYLADQEQSTNCRRLPTALCDRNEPSSPSHGNRVHLRVVRRAGGHLYGTRYWLPMWADGFRKLEKHHGYRRKAAIGYGIFFAAILVGFAAGGIAEYWGGGW